MAEQEGTESTETAPAEADATSLGDAGKKALDAERAARKTAESNVKTLAAQLKALEDSGKTELQKLTERLDSAEKAAAASAKDAMRLRVGAEHKLPKEIVARLQGDTEEEMAADAAALSEVVKQRARPSGDVDQGVKGTAGKKEPRDVFAGLFGK